ncbi:MAG: PIN domain-containing protein [Acidobacteriota bacterium]|nr:PIN domain-containing protein [Acidobacteriota bacterium]
MSRIYWDTMLFIYLLEDHPEFAPRVRQLLERSYKRRDALCTSYLALGEVLAGAEKSPQPEKTMAVRQTLQEMGFSYLPFDGGAVGVFSRLRARERLRVADSIHLACAASAGIDLFLTGDQQLIRLDIPGIQFVANFNTPVL